MHIADQSSIINDHIASRLSDENVDLTHEELNEFLIDDPSINQSNEIIHDYFIWSIINSFFGFWFFGWIALIYSCKTKYSRRTNVFHLARQFSRRTLIWNAAATLLAPAAWAGIIFLTKVLNKHD